MEGTIYLGINVHFIEKDLILLTSTTIFIKSKISFHSFFIGIFFTNTEFMQVLE